MGLDLLQFAWKVENAFGLYIREADSAALATPGLLIDYLAGRLAPSNSSQCVDQMAFHRVRSAALQILDVPRSSIRPETEWRSVLPAGVERRHAWDLMQHVVSVPEWPKLSFLSAVPRLTPTVGSTATFIATRCPGAIKGQAGTWTKAEITRVVSRLMAEQLGITEFQLTDRFVQDLRVD